MVDAEDRLLPVTVDQEAVIVSANRTAVDDKRPKTDEVLRESLANTTFETVTSDNRHAGTLAPCAGVPIGTSS
ncbi:hypothetical protein [Nocardia sp. NPDC056000]|uniref:hypothetical protein n=1 Tax=Nocardia sp. NPDC056000 TaxID=3345674 RepID=UPI0035DB005F